ncbi:pancreatic lipase-related protein 2 [Ceratina calcarata]|uniref:phospholipase A1 n=1 Tax=Ceratina calcarata TaxID=156304 RepID=A0AAJ7JF00_9HYME|nr:pancreatic lipase-related protein 2 [Ceratina calcarata]
MIAKALFTLLFSSVLLTVSSAHLWDAYVHMVNFTVHDVESLALPNVDTISFNLYTRQNPENGTLITLNDARSVQASYWNMTKPTAILIHGWNSDGSSEFNTKIRDAFFQVMDINVIVVDWGKIARDLVYSTVVFDVPYVAKHVAAFIDFLRTNANLRYSNLKIIGHSLGAHVAGLAAKYVSSNGLVAELVGLDPAKPLYEAQGPDGRIDRSQAQYVEIVHTCAGLLGLAKSLGTSDFYANDGRDQPGCSIDLTGGCAHERSYLYFIESIKNPKGFPGISESDRSTAYMGGATLDLSAKGSYHFNTTGTPPYTVNN